MKQIERTDLYRFIGCQMKPSENESLHRPDHEMVYRDAGLLSARGSRLDLKKVLNSSKY